MTSSSRNTDRLEWIEVTATVPVDSKEAVIGWFMDRGSAGVQEDYPGLFPADGDGPVTSGDPREWAGQAPPNQGKTVVLKGWLESTMPPQAAQDALKSFLSTIGDQYPGAPDSEVSALEIETKDWNAEWKSSWKPVKIGNRFLICPTWEERPDTDRTVILLDPGMAFGTGTHFTTASCIEEAEKWFEDVKDPASVSVLDVGTGSGILAIAALKMGAKSAFGIDVDPDATAASIENAAVNHVDDRYSATDHPLTGQERQYDLVFANILAQTLMMLAEQIVATVARDGRLITSGILQEYEKDVVKTFCGLGMKMVSTRRDDTWSTVVFGV